MKGYMKIYENIAIRTSLLLLCSFCSVARAQHEGWHLKDREEDGFWGISLDKAYQFLKNKGYTVIMDACIKVIHALTKDKS